MNEELKALLTEAYDRGASKADLDVIAQAYSKKKKNLQRSQVHSFPQNLLLRLHRLKSLLRLVKFPSLKARKT